MLLYLLFTLRAVRGIQPQASPPCTCSTAATSEFETTRSTSELHSTSLPKLWTGREGFQYGSATEEDQCAPMICAKRFDS